MFAPCCQGYPVDGMWTVPELLLQEVLKTGIPWSPSLGVARYRVLSSGPPGSRPKLKGLTTSIAPVDESEEISLVGVLRLPSEKKSLYSGESLAFLPARAQSPYPLAPVPP